MERTISSLEEIASIILALVVELKKEQKTKGKVLKLKVIKKDPDL